MFSVFSNTETKPSDQIRTLQNCAGSLYTRELIAGPDDEPLWILKPNAICWLIWVNKKILFELPNINYRTVDVRLRIATNMLNKLEQSNIIPKDISIQYHERLVKNVNRLVGLINIEDLPF